MTETKTRVVKVSLALWLETATLNREETKMMKIIGLVIGWIRTKWSGPACCCCGVCETELFPDTLCEYRGGPICRRCMSQPWATQYMDLVYWEYHPEEIPACKHCREFVPPLALESAVRNDWYFCEPCASKNDVMLYWARIRRKIRERQAKELGLRKW